MSASSSYTVLGGNTIRITATFIDFDEDMIDPDIVKFILYDNSYKKIDEISLGNDNRIGVGVYFADYVVPVEDCGNTFVYEMYGEINGLPALNRESFKVVFLS